MPYNDNEFKTTNVNYLNKDFVSLKRNLVDYAKTYFENSYKDFNETSPGMMLIEMSAYVGDVLSFYIDQQYREMLLPLAEEKRNIINISKMLGYKVKPIIPSFVNLTVKQKVDADRSDINNIVPTFADAAVIDKNMKITAASDSTIVFETLGVADFTATGSADQNWTAAETELDSDGLITSYTLERTVKAISGETKTKTFSVSAPEKFLKLTLPETNVIDVLSVYDSNGNRWHEVEYLAQDKIPKERHYLNDDNRTTAYTGLQTTDPDDEYMAVPVPYTLEYIKTSKRFTTAINDDNTLSLVFGNGILKNGQQLETAFFASEQAGITIPGQASGLDSAIDNTLGDDYDTLGESPAHTTLTVQYRVGGGITANVSSGELTTIDTVSALNGASTTAVSVTNTLPARGGSSQPTVDEIRERASAHFATQNRCVTKADFAARTFAMPARFGNIAKVFVQRKTGSPGSTDVFRNVVTSYLDVNADGAVTSGDTDHYILLKNNMNAAITAYVSDPTESNIINMFNQTANFQTMTESFRNTMDALVAANLDDITTEVASVEIYTLSYDMNKNLVNTPLLIQNNLKQYLNEYRMVTDEIVLKDGYIINFGVFFDVVAHRYANKQEVKLQCIQKITEYFKIDKMQFRQPLYTSQLEYELMGIDGVRAVNYVTLSQQGNGVVSTDAFDPALWYKAISSAEPNGIEYNNDGTGLVEGDYGWFYEFASALHGGVIRPPIDPAVFELKNPKQNIKGKVH